MKPENYINDYKQIINDIVMTANRAELVERLISSYRPKDLTAIEALRMDIIETFSIVSLYLQKCKESADKLGSIVATTKELLPPPKAGIRRFIYVDNMVKEVSLEEAAKHEGLSIPEYLEREQAELDLEDDVSELE